MPSSTTELTCVACGQECEHELVVVGRLLQSTRCSACGHVVRHEQRDLMSAYLRDLEHRLPVELSWKPAQLIERGQRVVRRVGVGVGATRGHFRPVITRA